MLHLTRTVSNTGMGVEGGDDNREDDKDKDVLKKGER